MLTSDAIARECELSPRQTSPTSSPTAPNFIPPKTVRTKRVREARDEAKREIDEYKSKKEDEYKKFEAEVRSQNHQRRGNQDDFVGS